MLDHPGDFSEAHGGPKMAQNRTKMAQNHQKWSIWSHKAQNGPSDSKTCLIHDYMSYWATLGTFSGPRGLYYKPKQHQNHHSEPNTVLRGITHDYMSYWATLGTFRGPRGLY